MGRDADRVVGAAGEPVRAFFDSYLAQDRAAAERLAAEDFVFTSPQDDHIDRATFFELPGVPASPQMSPWVGSSSAQRLTKRSATPYTRLGPAVTTDSLTGHDNPAAGIA